MGGRRRDIAVAGMLAFAAAVGAHPALAEVDIRTPWANVYVGPGGLYVHGPWGRVDVPTSDRAKICRQWRESVIEHYKDRRCDIAFDDEGCVIEKLECEDAQAKP